MSRLKTYVMFILLLSLAACTVSSEDELVISVQEFSPSYKYAIDTIFENRNAEGSFLLENLQGNKQLAYNTSRLNEGFLPASTFKIMNTMIFLQEGVATDSTVIQWDSIDRGWDKWDRDITLKDAFRYSAVWAYQKLATELGKARIQYWVTKCGYGNATLGGNVNDFWLSGQLRITPAQQVDFLRKFYRNDLPFDTKVQMKVKEIMKMESNNHYSWYYKTGWVKDSKPDVVWNVGMVETTSDVYVYALNIDAENDKKAELRKKLPTIILKQMDILPDQAEGGFK